MGLGNVLYKGFQQVKAGVERLPGAHKAYKWVTTRTGEGKVYEITRGPMAGMRWRRRNSLPFWYHLGIYEPETSHFLARHLRPGDYRLVGTRPWSDDQAIEDRRRAFANQAPVV